MRRKENTFVGKGLWKQAKSPGIYFGTSIFTNLPGGLEKSWKEPGKEDEMGDSGSFGLLSPLCKMSRDISFYGFPSFRGLE